MSLRTKGLVLAMEEDMETLPASSEEVAESMVGVADDVSEVEESAAEVAEYDEAIDATSSDAETLEKIQDVMEESVEKGEGLDETSAEIAEIAIEAICARVGIKKRVMPAMESFGSSNSRVVATKIAVEGIGDSLKSIWEAIKNAFISMTKAIEQFLVKWFTSLGRAKETITKLQSTVKGFTKTSIKDAEFENSAISTAFAISGKADASTAKTILENHVNLTSKVLKGLNDIKSVAKELNVVDGSDTSDFWKEAQAFVGTVGEDSGSLVGGANIVFKPVEQDKAFKVEFKLEFKKAAEAQKVKTLSKAEMEALIVELNKLLSASEEYKKQSAAVKAISDEIINIAKSQTKLAEKLGSMDSNNKDEKSKVVAASKAASASANNIKTLLASATTKVPSLNIRAIQQGINYINASMKNYE